ncbi:radical SAM protein [bacterium]|nr:radical SAM protein [bacterium]
MNAGKNRLRRAFTKWLQASEAGRELLFRIKKTLKRLPEPDLEFPEAFGLEITSVCNLSCVHCPPHHPDYRHMHRKYGHMPMALFEKLMDEIDTHGPRRIALHKDGEPLLHPEIRSILKRVKARRDHTVYLTTNAHSLDESVQISLIENRIDHVNFSLGAATAAFYEKVRGPRFDRVIDNIRHFLNTVRESPWKPRISMQIIDLPEYPEMKAELRRFHALWRNEDVEIAVWKKLNWGVIQTGKSVFRRYPCYSLWEIMFVNSDGIVSPCCMDWTQALKTGNAAEQSLSGIWKGELQKRLREYHTAGREQELPLCASCNYWSWLPKLAEYPI